MLDGKITTNNAKNATRVTTTKNAVCGAITTKDTTHGILTAYAPYDHNQLYNRETSDQHPIEAITGLRAALDAGSAGLSEAREEFNAGLAREADLRHAADQELADDLANEKASLEAAIDSAIDTSKTYADDNFVAKIGTETQAGTILYGRTHTGDERGFIVEAASHNPDSIVQRKTGGAVEVGTPVADNDATTKEYVDGADAKKLNLTGGTIAGSLAIQGDLTVTGTTTTETAQTLAVKDSVIVTNADGAELGVTLSGIAIRKDGENTYGVMYDPSSDSVKLGLGTLNAENKFTFNDSGTDGRAIATRADSSALNDGNLVKWDDTTKSLVDGGKKTDDFVEKVTTTSGSNLAYVSKNDGTQGMFAITTAASGGTIAQRKQDGGALEVGTPVDVNDATTKKYVDNGFVPIHNTGAPYTVYATAQSAGKIVQTNLSFSQAPIGNTIVQRGADGVVHVGDAVADNDAVNKKQVEDNFIPKSTFTDAWQVLVTGGSKDTITTRGMSADPISQRIVNFDSTGRLKTNNPDGTEPTEKSDKYVVNVGYANANYVAKTTAKNIAYTTNNDGVANTTHMSFNPDAWNLATFDGKACLRTSDPTGDDGRQCVNKQYADAHYVKSVAGTTNAPAVYIRGQDGTDKTVSLDSLTASAYSVAQRDVNGNIKVGTASANGDAVNKQYAEDNFVPKGTHNQAVYVRRSNGTDTMIPYTDGSSQETIAYRGVGGVLGVGTPTQAGHATNKAYVDNLNTITITAGA